MLRFSVLVGILLLVSGASSKALSAWGKASETVVQDTVMSVDDGKLPLGLKEVEPPEQLDVTNLDIDQSALIWKAVMDSRRRHHSSADSNIMPAQQQHQQGRYQQAEEDMDDMYHRFPDPQLVEQQEEDSSPLGQQQEQASWANGYHMAEVDMDDLYHADMGQPQGQAEAGQGRQQQQGAWMPAYQPEEDMDAVYHADRGQVKVETPLKPAQGDMSEADQRGRYEPEEDNDDLYHKY